ncbi:MAG: cyclophilin-like fold protein [Erysipelotrichaceae bacterium]|nr:cyclophilin-like fold protein [Erysipelotrichaceae bacterium]
MWYVPFVIVTIAVLAILYMFTPIGFLGVSPQGEYQIRLTINGHEMGATMENNSSAQALRQMLERGPKTIQMRDYGGMEKVGMIWKGLPTNDENITTKPGDLILFMGNSFVVYYEPNNWNFTKLGHINDTSQDELKEILGTGNVTIILSLYE